MAQCCAITIIGIGRSVLALTAVPTQASGYKHTHQRRCRDVLVRPRLQSHPHLFSHTRFTSFALICAPEKARQPRCRSSPPCRPAPDLWLRAMNRPCRHLACPSKSATSSPPAALPTGLCAGLRLAKFLPCCPRPPRTCGTELAVPIPGVRPRRWEV